MGDRGHLGGAERPVSLRAHEYRCGGGRLLGGEYGLVGDGELDGRGLYAVHRLDGVGELALQRALVGRGLLEGRGGDAEVVQQAVTVVAERGQAGGGRLQALRVDILLGNQDGGAAVGELVRHPIGVEEGRDRAGVTRRKAGEQRRIGRGAHPGGERNRADNKHAESDDRDRALPDRELAKRVREAADRRRQCGWHYALMFMMLLNASTDWLRTAETSWTSTCARVEAIVALAMSVDVPVTAWMFSWSAVAWVDCTEFSALMSAEPNELPPSTDAVWVVEATDATGGVAAAPTIEEIEGMDISSFRSRELPGRWFARR